MAAGVHSTLEVQEACLQCYAESGCVKMELDLVHPCHERCTSKDNLGYAYPGPDGCPRDSSRPEYYSNIDGYSYTHCIGVTRSGYKDKPECDEKYPCDQWQTESDYNAAQKVYNTERRACSLGGEMRHVPCTHSCSLQSSLQRSLRRCESSGGS